MMGIFRDLSEGLALSQQSPVLAAVGLVAASVFAVHWIRKNAAPRLREQRRARAFDRVLETARALEELAGMRSLTDEQRASFAAALIENGEGTVPPKTAAKTEEEAAGEPGVEPNGPPPPWFLDRVERLVDAGVHLFLGLGAIGLGVGCFFLVYDMMDRELDVMAVVIGGVASLFGVSIVVAGVRMIAKQVGIELGFIDDAKAWVRAKLTPPDWIYVIVGLALLSAPYVLSIGFFVYMAHWCMTTSSDVRPDEWVITAVCGLVAVGAVVKAVQKLRAFFYFPEDSASPAS